MWMRLSLRSLPPAGSFRRMDRKRVNEREEGVEWSVSLPPSTDGREEGMDGSIHPLLSLSLSPPAWPIAGPYRCIPPLHIYYYYYCPFIRWINDDVTCFVPLCFNRSR